MSLALSAPCPEFDLPGTDDKKHSLATMSSAEILVVIVSCNHCPYVVAYEERMVSLSREYASRGVQFVAVNANDASRYPDDAMGPMKTRVKERGFDFPYLRDDAQTFVRALGARFTPEVFVFDKSRKLRYQGRIDDNHKSAQAAKSHDLKDAIDALLAGREPKVTVTQAVGCSVKWK